MGLQVSRTKKNEIDVVGFFASLDQKPAYLRNVKPSAKPSLRKCNLSFTDVDNMYFVQYKGQKFAFPKFQAQQMCAEYDRIIAGDGKGMEFQKYAKIAKAKYPHVSQNFITALFDFVKLDATMRHSGTSDSASTRSVVPAAEYTQLMYLLNHYNLIMAAPMAALFLFADNYFVYSVQHGRLQLLLYQHYGLTETEYLQHFKIPIQHLSQFITLKRFLHLLPNLENVSKLSEPFFFPNDEEESIGLTTVENEEQLDINNKLRDYLRSQTYHEQEPNVVQVMP